MTPAMFFGAALIVSFECAMAAREDRRNRTPCGLSFG